MLRLIFVSVILIFSHSLSAQINQDWERKDELLFDNVAAVVKCNPLQVEQMFNALRYPKELDSLGFGWTKLESAMPGGYLSIHGIFYYFKDSLISYRLYTDLPDQDLPIDKYVKMYVKVFNEYKNRELSFEFNGQAIRNPLPDYFRNHTRLDTSAKLLTYMSPMSGLVYGIGGGIVDDTLENRKIFNRLLKQLSPEDIVQIIYSVNPASRLTAIEYYLKHKQRFANHSMIDQWISEVYKKSPLISSMNGCLMYRESAESLVREYSR